jgi:methionine synthase II (cobalamin-independent)
MRKLNATIFALQRRKIPSEHLDEVRYWWDRLEMGNPEEVISLLQNRPKNDQNVNDWQLEILKLRLRFNLRFLESTGLDFIFTGEAWRREMYEHVAKDVDGIYLEKEHVRSFDDRFYKPGVRVKDVKINRRNPIYIEEFEYAKQMTNAPLRFCFTGPYTTFNWTIKPIDDYQFFFDLIDNVYIPEIKDLIKRGAQFITSDEPAYTTFPTDRDVYIEAYQRFFQGIKGVAKEHNTRIGFHTCFSDRYDILFDDLPKLPWAYCSLEFANRDGKTLGTSHSERPSFKEGVEKMIDAYNAGSRCKLSLGVLEVHADRRFTIEELQSGIAYTKLRQLIRDRLIYQTKYLYDELGEDGAFSIMSAPDCGLRPVNRLTDLHLMFSSLVDGTKEARSILRDDLDLPNYKSN